MRETYTNGIEMLTQLGLIEPADAGVCAPKLAIRPGRTKLAAPQTNVHLGATKRHPPDANVRLRQSKSLDCDAKLRLRHPEFHLPKMKLLHREMKPLRGDVENSERMLRRKENRPSRGAKRDLVTSSTG